jgi:hypothetical protein
VLTRADSSDSWTDVTPWSNPITGNLGPQLVTIDISDDIGPGTQIRFEFDGYYWNLDDWYIDDVVIYSTASRESGELVYSAETMVDISAYSTADIDFTPRWCALPGTYALKVTTQLAGDQNNNNNQKSVSVIVVENPLPADFNGDCYCDLTDFVIFSGAWLSRPGDPNWNPLCDLDDSGNIDMTDFTLFAGYYGTSCP